MHVYSDTEQRTDRRCQCRSFSPLTIRSLLGVPLGAPHPYHSPFTGITSSPQNRTHYFKVVSFVNFKKQIWIFDFPIQCNNLLKVGRKYCNILKQSLYGFVCACSVCQCMYLYALQPLVISYHGLVMTCQADILCRWSRCIEQSSTRHLKCRTQSVSDVAPRHVNFYTHTTYV